MRLVVSVVIGDCCRDNHSDDDDDDGAGGCNYGCVVTANQEGLVSDMVFASLIDCGSLSAERTTEF